MGKYDDGDDEGKMSEFNAAALKMRRLDKIESSMNEISTNLFAFNDEFGVFNFEVKLSRCNQLYQEVESKLTKPEKEQGTSLKEAIEKMLEKYPVFKPTKNNKKQIKVDNIMKKIIVDWIFKYETLVRQFKDEHGMDTSYRDDDGL